MIKLGGKNLKVGDTVKSLVTGRQGTVRRLYTRFNAVDVLFDGRIEMVTSTFLVRV